MRDLIKKKKKKESKFKNLFESIENLKKENENIKQMFNKNKDEQANNINEINENYKAKTNDITNKIIKLEYNIEFNSFSLEEMKNNNINNNNNNKIPLEKKKEDFKDNSYSKKVENDKSPSFNLLTENSDEKHKMNSFYDNFHPLITMRKLKVQYNHFLQPHF